MKEVSVKHVTYRQTGTQNYSTGKQNHTFDMINIAAFQKYFTYEHEYSHSLLPNSIDMLYTDTDSVYIVTLPMNVMYIHP